MSAQVLEAAAKISTGNCSRLAQQSLRVRQETAMLRDIENLLRQLHAKGH